MSINLEQFEGHALGPYRVRVENLQGHQYVSVDCQYRPSWIAKISPTGEMKDAEAVQTGKLFAAAPDLLAELKEVRLEAEKLRETIQKIDDECQKHIITGPTLESMRGEIADSAAQFVAKKILKILGEQE